MKKWLILLRVEEYVKNLLVFFPAFFGAKIFSNNNFLSLVFTFVIFCFLTSAIYIINDIFDKRFDIKHPLKKYKPLTSGKISTTQAIAVTFFLLLIVFWGCNTISLQLLKICFVYLAINLFYSSIGKHIPILDILLITFGFLLRLQTGSVVTGVIISFWLYVMIFLLAIGFVFVKRMNEVQFLKLNQVLVSEVRPSLKYYPASMSKYAIILVVFCAMLCYFFYTVSSDTITRLNSNLVFVTVFPALTGSLRYIYLVKSDRSDILPLFILKNDRWIQVSLCLWIVMMFFLIYGR